MDWRWNTRCAENADDGTYENRAFSVAGEDMTLATVYWNYVLVRAGETFTVTFQVNTSAIVGGVGANGIYAGGEFLEMPKLWHYLMMMVMVFG